MTKKTMSEHFHVSVVYGARVDAELVDILRLNEVNDPEVAVACEDVNGEPKWYLYAKASEVRILNDFDPVDRRQVVPLHAFAKDARTKEHKKSLRRFCRDYLVPWAVPEWHLVWGT